LPFDLEPTEEQRALKQTLTEFAAEVLRPAARDCEDAGRTSDEILKQLFEIGVAAPVSEDFGGGGTLDAVTYMIAAEELAWGDPGIAYHALVSGLAALVIDRAGSEKQKKTYLPGFAEAPLPSFVALGERFSGADLEGLETTLDGSRVRGEKYGVLNATQAPLGVVVGRDSDELGAIVLEGGFEVLKAEDKLGLRAAPTAVVRFDTEGDRLAGGDALQQALLLAKLLTGAIAVGCGRASLDYAAEYATGREAFGRPIGGFQAISFKIADMATLVDAARGSLWRVAWKIDRGVATLADVAEANGQAMAAAVVCGDDGVQVLGGHGYIQDHPVEKWFRDAVTLSVFDAPDTAGDAMAARSLFGQGGS